MATFTSVTSGNWNDGATWGMTSPGVKGTDWPGLAGDIANIGTTVGQSHIVTYNVSETNELGTVTIGAASGTGYSRLDFSTTTNTLLSIGTGTDLVINATGELRVGTSTTPIPSTYTAQIGFNTNNDNARGFSVAAGGKYSFYGDNAYYGNDYDTALASNWTSGQTFTVVGNFTTAWKVGQLLYVHKGTTWAATATDNAAVTIASLTANGANTDITINESFPTGSFYANGDVINLSRNVKVFKIGGSSAVNNNNTNRWRIYDANGSTAYNTVGYCAFSNVEFMGLYRFIPSTPIVCERVVIRNSSDGPAFSGIINNVSASLISVSNSSLVYTARMVNFTDSVFIAGAGIGACVGCSFSNTTRVYGASSPIGVSIGEKTTRFSGAIYSCNYAMQDGAGILFDSAVLGYDLAGNSKSNTANYRFASHLGKVFFRSCKVPATPTFYSRNNDGYPVAMLYCFEHYNRTLNDHRVYGGYGDAIKVEADGVSSRPSQRTGGNLDIIEITTQSNCNVHRYFYGFLEHQIWAEAGVSKTYRYYVQTDFDSLPASEIELKGEYISDATEHTISSVVSSQAIITRSSGTDWSRYVEVTINPAETGWVRLSMKIMGYESTHKIWIDPKVSII